MIGQLFNAAASLLPSVRAVQQTVDLVGDLGNAYQTVTAVANQFYSATISSNLELQGIIRQSSVIIAAQTNLFDAVGNNVTDFDAKLAAITPRVKGIQREIEVATRDIVGATDTQTNAILGQVINQFSVLQGQTRAFADELSAVPTLVAGITSAMNTFQIPEFQIPQEVRSLLQGDLNNPDSQLATQLQSTGLTKEAFEQARAQGKLIDLLIEKTNAFRQANASASDSIVNSFSIIQDITSQTLRVMGEDPTEGLRQGLTSITALLANGELEKKISNIAQSFGGPIGEAISSSMALATNSISQFVESLGAGRIEAFAENVGQLIGDTISIVSELGTAVTVIVARIVNSLSEAWDRLETFAKFITLDFSFEGKVNPIPDELQTTVEQEIEDFDKDLNQKGLLKRAYDLIVNINPVYQITKAIKQGSDVGEIKKAADSTLKILQNDIESSKPQIDFLMELAPKIANVDTTSISNFRVNGLAPIQNEIKRLEDSIDFSKLSEKASEEVSSTLNSIVSSGDFGAAQAKITDIMRKAQMGSDEELNKYSVYSNLLKSRIEALKNQRDELTTLAKEGGLTDELESKISKVNTLYSEQVQLQGSLAEASNPAIAAKQREIAEAQKLGKSTAELTNSLKELQIQARESMGAELGFSESQKFGSALVKTYNDLSAAIDSYNDKRDATPEKANQDFEELLKNLEAAEQVGSVGFASLKNLMVSAIKDQYLGIEQRQQALEKYNQLVEAESRLQTRGIELKEKSLELTVQTGEIEREDSTIQSNKLELSKNQIEIEKVRQQLAAQRALEEEGSAEALDQQIAAQRALLDTADETTKVNIKNEISKLEEQKTQLEIGSAKRQELELTLKNLEINEELITAKGSQLNIDKKLAEISRQKEEDSAKLAINSARREREIAELREAGLLDSDLAIEKAETEIDIQKSKLDLIRDELRAKQQLLSEADNIPLEQRLSLQKEVNNLIADETNAQAGLLNSRLDFEEQLRNALVEKQKIILETANVEADANQQLEDSFYKIEEAILNTEKAQQDLLSSSIAIQTSLNQNKIVEYDIRLAGIDRINDLSDKFEEGNYALNAAISDSISWIQDNLDITNTGLAEQLRIIDEKAALEQANADITYQFKLEELKLESEINNLKLEGDNAQLESQKLQLEMKREELELEKQILQNKVDNGELSQEDADKRIAATDKILQANDNLIESLDVQVNSNNKMLEASSSILENRSNLLTIEKDTEDTTRKTATNYEKQDLTIKSIGKAASKSSGESKSSGSGTTNGTTSGGGGSGAESARRGKKYTINGVEFDTLKEARNSGLINPSFVNTKADRELADIRAKKFGVNSVASALYRGENGGDGSAFGMDSSSADEFYNSLKEKQKAEKEATREAYLERKKLEKQQRADDKAAAEERERQESDLRASRKNAAKEAKSQSKDRLDNTKTETAAQVQGAGQVSGAIAQTTQNYNAAAQAAASIRREIDAIPSNKTVTVTTVNTSTGGGGKSASSNNNNNNNNLITNITGASSRPSSNNNTTTTNAGKINNSLGLPSGSTIGKQLANGTGSFVVNGNGMSGGKVVGSGFGGFRERGGGVEVGKTYIVGEAGPELFIPTTTGHVLSNEDTKKAAKNFGGNLAGGTVARATNNALFLGGMTRSTNPLGAATRYTGDKYGVSTYIKALEAAKAASSKTVKASAPQPISASSLMASPEAVKQIRLAELIKERQDAKGRGDSDLVNAIRYAIAKIEGTEADPNADINKINKSLEQARGQAKADGYKQKTEAYRYAYNLINNITPKGALPTGIQTSQSSGNISRTVSLGSNSNNNNNVYSDGDFTTTNPNLQLAFDGRKYVDPNSKYYSRNNMDYASWLKGTSYTGSIIDPTEQMQKALESTQFAELFAKNAEQIKLNRERGFRVDALDEDGNIPFYLTKEFSTQLSVAWNEAVENLEKSAEVAGLKIEESFDVDSLTNQLAALLRSPEQNKETRAQIERISGQLGEQLRNTEEQVSLLDALKQGSFQGGGYKQSSNTSTFLDAATGQIIVGGTRPDFSGLSKLSQLPLSPSLPQLQENTPVVQQPQPSATNTQQSIIDSIRAQLASRTSITNGTTIINNYPDLAGSVNSQLRSAAL